MDGDRWKEMDGCKNRNGRTHSLNLPEKPSPELPTALLFRNVGF